MAPSVVPINPSAFVLSFDSLKSAFSASFSCRHTRFHLFLDNIIFPEPPRVPVSPSPPSLQAQWGHTALPKAHDHHLWLLQGIDIIRSLSWITASVYSEWFLSHCLHWQNFQLPLPQNNPQFFLKHYSKASRGVAHSPSPVSYYLWSATHCPSRRSVSNTCYVAKNSTQLIFFILPKYSTPKMTLALDAILSWLPFHHILPTFLFSHWLRHFWSISCLFFCRFCWAPWCSLTLLSLAISRVPRSLTIHGYIFEPQESSPT